MLKHKVPMTEIVTIINIAMPAVKACKGLQKSIIKAIMQAQAIYEKPTVIIAHTVPGKGVSFMERNYKWHGKAPNKEEAEQALAELKSHYA